MPTGQRKRASGLVLKSWSQTADVERETDQWHHKYRPILYTGDTGNVTGLGGLGACLGILVQTPQSWIFQSWPKPPRDGENCPTSMPTIIDNFWIPITLQIDNRCFTLQIDNLPFLTIDSFTQHTTDNSYRFWTPINVSITYRFWLPIIRDNILL